MKITDVSTEPAVGVILDLLQHITRAATAQEAFEAFVQRYWRLRPVEHLIGVQPLAEGGYKVIFHADSEAIKLGGASPARNPAPAILETLPTHRGGLIGAATATPSPKWVTDLDLRDDPALRRIAGARTCLAIPLYSGRDVNQWIFGFSSQIPEMSTIEVQQALMTANLMGMNNANLRMVEEIRGLNRRLTGQLEEVAQIQQSLLPERLPEIPGLSIATSYLTSDQAGGDYYDFFPLPDGRWAILIADVSGHGAAAATVMAMLHGILHCYSGPDSGPETILAYANAKLLQAGISGSFVTAFLAMYDPSDATLAYASSGHNPPRLKEGRTGAVRAIDEPASLPLGIVEPYEIAAGTLRLGPNDTVVMYTDGITEEFNGAREMFGVERLDAALDGCSGDPECVVGSVHGALFEHTRARTRADDQTIVAFRYVGPEGGLGRNALTRRVMADAAAALAGVAS